MKSHRGAAVHQHYTNIIRCLDTKQKGKGGRQFKRSSRWRQRQCVVFVCLLCVCVSLIARTTKSTRRSIHRWTALSLQISMRCPGVTRVARVFMAASSHSNRLFTPFQCPHAIIMASIHHHGWHDRWCNEIYEQWYIKLQQRGIGSDLAAIVCQNIHTPIPAKRIRWLTTREVSHFVSLHCFKQFTLFVPIIAG